MASVRTFPSSCYCKTEQKDISSCLLLGETIKEETSNLFHFQFIRMQEAQITSHTHTRVDVYDQLHERLIISDENWGFI